MKYYDKLTLVGRVGKGYSNPIQSSPNFTIFSVAVEKNWQSEPGVWQKKVKWYQCYTSNSVITQQVKGEVKKGSLIYVEGVPNINSYKDHKGVLTHNININISKFDILTPPPKNNDSVNFKNEYNKAQEPLFSDDSIPF